MDLTSYVIIVVIALLVLIVVSAFLVFQKYANVKVNDPLGMKLDIHATNQSNKKSLQLKTVKRKVQEVEF